MKAQIVPKLTVDVAEKLSKIPLSYSDLPIISDINDYQGVHLVGLSFTRAGCIKQIAEILPINHKLKKALTATANKSLANALPLVSVDNYGDHWLASFAVYALED